MELHRPLAHSMLATLLDAQARPHAPQLAGSPLTLISQPSAGWPLQSTKSVSQRKTLHAPLESQPAVAWLTLHGAQDGAAQPNSGDAALGHFHVEWLSTDGLWSGVLKRGIDRELLQSWRHV